MRRLILAVLGFVVVGLVDTGVAASRARRCREACGQVIAACIEQGGRRRACRRATLRRCKRVGTSTCLVAPTTTIPASSTTTTVRLASTTTTTQPPQGLYGLFGTWEVTYSIISTYVDRYVMSSVDTSGEGMPYILAYDVYGGAYDTIVARAADLGFPSSPFEFAMLDASFSFCDFFVFNRTGANTLSGQYYLTDVDFDGTCGDILNAGDPYPMAGVRISSAAVAAEAGSPGAPVALGDLVRALEETPMP